MLLKDIRFLITQNPDRTILEHVDVRVADGRITEIGENLTNDDRAVDCSGKVVMPGLVNAHTHAAMNLLRGISDNKTLQDWLEDDIFPAEDEMTEDDVYHGTRHATTEMVRTGTTCFNDMYLGEPAARAVDETGMRAVLARGMVDNDSGGDKRLQESKSLLQGYQDHDRITPAVSPHAIYTCSEELLQQAKEQADRFNAQYHIHLSETKQENDDCESKHGMTPTAYLHDLGILDNSTIGAHGTWLTEHDMRLLQKTGAGIAHNPCANLKLGAGIADVPRLQAHDVTVGIGTDGVASNNSLNLFEEAKFASLLQKRQNPETMPAQRVLDMLTIDGVALLGLADRIGSIEEGKQADLVTVDLHEATMTPWHGTQGLLSNLVFAFHGQVTDTFVQGQRLLAEKKLVEMDQQEINRECQERAERLTG